MTENKPIMIDGIDVSKCADYDEDAYFTCQACNVCKCSELPNCYFKQLSRKTQECERHKLENKKLKQSLRFEEGCKNIILKERNQLKTSKEQAEQKLKKIHGIAKDFHYAIIPFHKGINHEMADRIDYYLNQILQIIDEVE